MADILKTYNKGANLSNLTTTLWLIILVLIRGLCINKLYLNFYNVSKMNADTTTAQKLTGSFFSGISKCCNGF